MRNTGILLITLLAMSACNQGPRLASGRYAGHDISDKAEIIKEPGGGNTQIRIDIKTSWQLYAGESDRAINFSQAVADGETGNGMFEVDVPVGRRTYFQLVTPLGKAIFAERRLPMEGGHNYRDMGGYRGTSGHYVKWGRVFRTDGMHNLTQADLDYLASIPLRTVVDFRAQEEIGRHPDRLPASVTDHIVMPIAPGELSGIADSMKTMDSGQIKALMTEMSALLVTDPGIVAQYRELFRIMQDESNLPLSFHCTAGKDRTGVAAALFLASLGVSEEVIIRDYLLSNKYTKEMYAPILEKYPHLGPVFSVDEAYIRAVFDRINEVYGSMEGFLRNTLGVNPQVMRKIYMYR